MKRSAILAVAVLLAFSLGAGAAEEKQPTSADASPIRATFDGPPSTAPIITYREGDKGIGTMLMDIDITGIASWDLQDDPDNVTILEFLGVGGVMTGVGWDVNLSTVGASWLSEAVMYFDEESLDGTGLFLTVGVADGAPGAMNYSSPVIDLSDNGITNIETGADGNLHIQFFESFDDVSDAVDSFYDDSGFPTPTGAPSIITIEFIPGAGFAQEVPTLSPVGLGGLVLLLAGLGVFLMRRRSLTAHS
jgi:hypothetical protein